MSQISEWQQAKFARHVEMSFRILRDIRGVHSCHFVYEANIEISS